MNRLNSLRNRRRSVALIWSVWLTIALAGVQPVTAEETVDATLYKNPSCRCCDDYAAYLRQHGFDVDVVATSNLKQVKHEHDVPTRLQGCHTLVVEGHVPVAAIEKLLRERPEIRGISLPGMPSGSPGMIGQKQAPLVVYTITDGEPSVYTTG